MITIYLIPKIYVRRPHHTATLGTAVAKRPTNAPSPPLQSCGHHQHISPDAMDPERIIPRIFYTQYEHVWSAERLRDHSFTHIVRIDHQHQAFEASAVDHNANEQPMCDFAGFDLVDLDFNSSPYATSVLPSCYKSVKFIERAMRGSGSVLIVGAGEDNALAIVIVVGYLMYKDHLRFR